MKTILCVLLALLFVNFAYGNQCPEVKTTTIKREHIKTIPVNIPYPHYKELPADAKFLTKCPPKFKQDGIKCIHKIKSKDICPPDYSRISDSQCIKIVLLDEPEDHVTHCPTGYQLNANKKCVVTEEYKNKYPKVPKFVVPQEPNVKVNLPKSMEPIECPQGYERKSPFRCSKIMRCETGKILKNGKCIRK
eukprot:gene497-8011_t